MRDKKLQIRNSTAEFLVFTAQSGQQSIEVRYEDETIWLTQKLLANLFDVDVRTVSTLKTSCRAGNCKRIQLSGNSGILPTMGRAT